MGPNISLKRSFPDKGGFWCRLEVGGGFVLGAVVLSSQSTVSIFVTGRWNDGRRVE